MIKRTLILMLALVFSLAGSSIAGVVELSDAAMDGVNAGDWVIVKDTEGNEKVEDVYTTNNTLWLLEESQKDMKGISNANAVDSAVAVQTNVARVSGDGGPSNNVAVNGSNTADINNYRPAESSSNSMTEVGVKGSSASSSSQKAGSTLSEHSGSFAHNSSAEHSFESGKSFDYDETLDIAVAVAGNTKEIGKGGVSGGNFAGVAVVDYDKTIDASSKKSASGSYSSGKAASWGGTKAATFSESQANSERSFEKNSKSTKTKTRNSKGVNNHILLDNTSQQNIQVVSNLNAVGSGVAVQNNIASNVGVSGTITHANTASVSSGF